MPGSVPEGKLFFRDWITQFRPFKILDVGVGAGDYGWIIRNLSYPCELHGVEIYAPYIAEFRLHHFYDYIYNEDIRKINLQNDYDLMIFGDVLEHMTKEEVLELWPKMKKRARFLWISLPIKVEGRSWSVGHKQPPAEYATNIYEKHLHSWTYDEILCDLGPFLWTVPFKIIGTFIAEGEIK